MPITHIRRHGVTALLAALLLLVCLVSAVATAAPVAVPGLSAHVVDTTGTLDDAHAQALEAQLTALEGRKGAQVVVLLVPTTGEETIEQYAMRVVEAWKLGRKGVDDGVLVLASMNDHKLRIEIGRGLEGTIPDAIANRIIDGYVEPRFRSGDYAGGLQAGVDRIAGLIDGGTLPWPPPQDVASNAKEAVAAPALAPLPAHSGHVVDAIGYLSDQERAALEAKLAAFEKAKGRQIALLLVDGTGDESHAHFAKRVFDTWNLGADGVLIWFTEQPYDEGIFVGRGLVDVFPVPIIKRILNEDMSWPRVKMGDIPGELKGGVDRIIRLQNGEAMPPPPPKPEGDFKETLFDALSPPPFELPIWLGMLVGLPFLFIVASGLLSWKAALLRGCVTSVVLAGFLLLLGAGWLFALIVAAIAFYPAILFQSDGPEPDWTADDSPSSHSSRSSGSSDVSFGSIAWSLLGMAASSALSSGGGSGGFSGGGGGFSGGGASGSW